jgi:hypothetical protein
MQYSIKDDQLKVDFGDHYYKGSISSDYFPEEIRDNYLDILQKSFENFIDEEYSVIKNFDDKTKYIINFHYKSKPFSFKRVIEIPMLKVEKDFKDYTNERIEKLENIVESLKAELLSLKTDKISEHIIDNESDLENDKDSDEESDAPEPISVRGGKKLQTVVQMKNGKQMISKK